MIEYGLDKEYVRMAYGLYKKILWFFRRSYFINSRMAVF